MDVAQQASDVLVGGDGLPASPQVAIAIAARERNVAHRVAVDVPVTAIDCYDVPVAQCLLLGGGLGLVVICVLAYYLIKYLDENNAEDDIGEPALAELRAKNCCTKCCTRNGRACQGILAVFMLAGGAALFLGLFVLDSMTAVLVGFVVLIVVVVFQVVWNICKDHRTYKKEVDKYGDKIEALDNKDDGDLHDDSGAETSTRYMDFEQ